MSSGARTNPTGYRSCQMCHYSFESEDATHRVTYGGKEYHVCEKHFHNPIPNPRAQVVDFKSDRNHYGSETSAQAAEQADHDAKLNDTHRRILGQLCIQPATPDEIAQIMRLNWSTARARMTDLKNFGFITSTGETRTAQGGKEANVMRPTTLSEREREAA